MNRIRKITGVLIVLLLLHLSAGAQNFVGKNIRIGLFSSTPLEDIRAVSDQGNAVLIAKTREIVVQLNVKTLEFDRKLMQEHFNENYIESDKYPNAKFKGMIDQSIDFTKDGDYAVTVTGILSVHGIDKKRTIPGKVTINNGIVQISTEFKVACIDHDIKIPKLVFTKIAEFITIKTEGKLNPLK
nr:YceI family protein [Pedobacter panaciterrae]